MTSIATSIGVDHEHPSVSTQRDKALLRKSIAGIEEEQNVRPKQPFLEAAVSCVGAHTAATPVSQRAGVEEFAPPVHSFLRWLDNWFRTSPEERMTNSYLAYWS